MKPLKRFHPTARRDTPLNRLCEKSVASKTAEKPTLPFDLWRVFIFGEGDFNPFFVLRIGSFGLFTQSVKRGVNEIWIACGCLVPH